jgi:gamma-glutamyltranspeptidase/glutathione hydrolase
MLSSMTPTIVARDGQLVLVTGSPGGRTIINTVLNVVLNVTAWKMSGREAVDAARSHHQWLPDRLTIEEHGVTEAVLEALRGAGHEVRTTGRQGSAQTIWVNPATRVAWGIADTRDSDAKAATPAMATERAR